MTSKVCLCDIDHTVSNSYWRDDMIGKVEWDEYHAAGANDVPIYDMVALFSSLSADNWTIIAMTGRPEKWRKMTVSWFMKFGISFDEIMMRPDNSFMTQPEVKLAMYHARFGPDNRPDLLIVFDNRDDVVSAFKGLGVTTLQVHGRKM